ncbi:type II secretion system minor pseudopilin GspK [Tibeticola sp.]|uniref:type II secretion system minor pseudopilin GspK n=1 Tax=Tibeticola sp. TaxID=2005368 RepID=UPI0025DD3734|nr:type II secretion system minor pseudopilin GspK [Tibeticola sp.]
MNRPTTPKRQPAAQRGAALLLAMLTVTLVASLAASALWQRWRSVEVESAERARQQAAWILTGALDWARLILREDARTGGADHLAEPWALPLQEARLSTFLAMDADSSAVEREAFLSGQIIDLQSRLNLLNLLDGDKLSPPAQQAFARLFEQLGLPASELNRLSQGLLAAQRGTRAGTTGADTPLMPQTLPQLGWLGLRPQTLARLAPHVSLLPGQVPVNVNTAGLEVLMAAVPGLSRADATRMLAERERAHYPTLLDNRLPAPVLAAAGGGQLAVASRFFEVHGRLRLDDLVVEEVSVVQRDGLSVKVLRRQRQTPPAPGPTP